MGNYINVWPHCAVGAKNYNCNELFVICSWVNFVLRLSLVAKGKDTKRMLPSVSHSGVFKREQTPSSSSSLSGTTLSHRSDSSDNQSFRRRLRVWESHCFLACRRLEEEFAKVFPQVSHWLVKEETGVSALKEANSGSKKPEAIFTLDCLYSTILDSA